MPITYIPGQLGLTPHRAFVAASRRKDRSLDARLESAQRASLLHKKRTGKALRITKDIVQKEAMYEEVDECYQEKRIRMLQAQNIQIEEQFQRQLLAAVAAADANANANANLHLRRSTVPSADTTAAHARASTSSSSSSPPPMRPQRNMTIDLSDLRTPATESIRSAPLATAPTTTAGLAASPWHYLPESSPGTCDPNTLPSSYMHPYMTMNMHMNMNSAADTMLYGIPSPPAESMPSGTNTTTTTNSSNSPDELACGDPSCTSSLPPSSYLMPSLLNSSTGNMDLTTGMMMPFDCQWSGIHSPSPTPDSTLQIDPLAAARPGSPDGLSGVSPFLLSSGACDAGTLPSSYMPGV